MDDAYTLELLQVTKKFPGVTALNDATIRVRPGEVHALVGANGAGKSTILKVMFGVYTPDAGTVKLKGQVIQPRSPSHAQQLGISMVHQELQLIPELNATQNMFLGREYTRSGLFVDSRRCHAEAEALLTQLGVSLNVRVPVRTLSVAQRQMVEIAKALLVKASVVAFDEPTSSLTPVETEHLFATIRGLKARGVAVIYVSHRLEELPQIADRASVMRDGRVVGEGLMSELNRAALVQLMTGRDSRGEGPAAAVNDRAGQAAGEELLRVVDLEQGTRLKGVSFSLRRGEILGITGLIGSGRTEMVRALYGADPARGQVFVAGRRVSIRSPQDAIAAGIGFLPEDRKGQGLLLHMPIRLNIALTAMNLGRLTRFSFLKNRAISATAADYVSQLNVQPPQPERVVGTLSGGNQQKVILARWLCAGSDIVIFDEPTRGIDVGAKVEIYRLMKDLVAQGKGILMISSELPEVLQMSDRILVMREGRIVNELARHTASETQIMHYATGGS